MLQFGVGLWSRYVRKEGRGVHEGGSEFLGEGLKFGFYTVDIWGPAVVSECP